MNPREVVSQAAAALVPASPWGRPTLTLALAVLPHSGTGGCERRALRYERSSAAGATASLAAARSPGSLQPRLEGSCCCREDMADKLTPKPLRDPCPPAYPGAVARAALLREE